jgi:hypothetical protein
LEPVTWKVVTKSGVVVSGRNTLTWPFRFTTVVHLPAG